MFKKWGKSEVEKLEAEYAVLLEKAQTRQRNGDIKGFAQLAEEAEELAKKIDALKAEEE